MTDFDWQGPDIWRGHRLKRWETFTSAIGMLGVGVGCALGAMALTPTANNIVWYGVGLAGLFIGERLGRWAAAWHVRAQQQALATFEQDFPTQEALRIAGATARRALRHTTLPTSDATLFIFWDSKGGHHKLKDIHVYTGSDDSWAVSLDQVENGRGAGGSPLLPVTHRARLWGAKPHASRSFQAPLALATAHQRLAFAAWLAATEHEDAAILASTVHTASAFDGQPAAALMRR